MEQFSNGNQDLFRLFIQQLAGEVVTALEPALREIIDDSLAKLPQGPDKLLYTTEEICELLSISKSTLFKLRKQGMPIVKIGDSVRFNLLEVEKFINNKISQL